MQIVLTNILGPGVVDTHIADPFFGRTIPERHKKFIPQAQEEWL